MIKIITIFSSVFIAAFLGLNAQNVKPDTAFGTDGFSILDKQTNGWAVINSEIQTDGKLIITGINTTTNNTEYYSFVARLNANGSLDTSFGTDGYLTLFTNTDTYFTNIYLVPDNKIVIFYSDIGKLVKLTANGTLDSSFGENGILTISTDSEFYNSTSVLYGNDLYVIKDDYPNVFLQRINLITEQITTINTGALINETLKPKELYKGPNNKLIVKSVSENTNDYKFFLSLFDTDGTIDASFGTDGTIQVNTINNEEDYETTQNYITLDANENILLGTSIDNILKTTISKYNTQGELVTGFGSNGKVVLNTLVISSIKVLSNQIYLSGAKVEAGKLNLMFARLNNNGELDTSFNGNGVFVETSNTYEEWAESANIISDVSFVAVGEFKINDDVNGIYAAKYKVDPTLSIKDNALTKNKVTVINPMQSTFQYTSNKRIEKIELYSITGVLVRTITENDNSISSLASGMYIANFVFDTNDNELIKVVKD